MGIPWEQNELKVGRATPLRDPDLTALGLEVPVPWFSHEHVYTKAKPIILDLDSSISV